MISSYIGFWTLILSALERKQRLTQPVSGVFPVRWTIALICIASFVASIFSLLANLHTFGAIRVPGDLSVYFRFFCEMLATIVPLITLIVLWIQIFRLYKRNNDAAGLSLTGPPADTTEQDLVRTKIWLVVTGLAGVFSLINCLFEILLSFAGLNFMFDFYFVNDVAWMLLGSLPCLIFVLKTG